MASLFSETSTVISDILDDTSLSGDFVSEANVPPVRANTKGKAEVDDLVATMNNTLEERPFFIRVGKDGIVAALEKLDEQLVAAGHNKVLSTKKPIDWTGKEIIPGRMGLINHGGFPKILTRPGRYPGFPLRNWWARSWCGTTGASDTVIEFQGLTIVQVSQNQAAVVSDPQNHIFVIKNSGFVAFAVEGTYDVLSIVDVTHLPTVVTDPLTKVTLGWTHEVKMESNVGGAASKDYVVATFLNIPARNCAILQKGDELVLLGAGQSVITNPSVTLHGLYTLGDNQLEMPTKDVFTRDEVPVSLRIYLKWQLTEPLKLAARGYRTSYDALRDKTQSILTHIAGHLDYSAMIKSQSPECGVDTSSAFLGALQSRAMDALHEAALGYGIVLKDLAVIDCRFKSEFAHTLNTLTTRALQAQVEATNVDRENRSNVKQKEGVLSVTYIKAQAAKIQEDSEAYQVTATAKAQAERTRIETQVQVEATRLTAREEANAILTKAPVDSQVLGQFSREMEVQRAEVAKVRAYESLTIFVPTDGAVRVEVRNTLASGLYL